MLSQTGMQVREGDTFSSDQGATWHKVADKFIARGASIDFVCFTTEDCQKVWLWADEEVMVRL